MAINSIQPIENMKSFVTADPNKLAHRAYRKEKIANSNETAKFDKRLNIAFNSIPFVAAASKYILTKSAKAAAKSGAGWGVAVLAPVLVASVNKAAVKVSPDIRKTERKHSGLTLVGLIGASFAAYDVGTRGLEKLSKNPTVNKIFDTVAEGSKDMFDKLKADVKIPEKLVSYTKKAGEFIKAKTPDIIKDFAKSTTAENVTNGAKNIAKKGLAHAPIIVAAGMFAAMIGKACSEAVKFNKIKSDIKVAQFETAKNLVNAYDAENAQLREENEILKAKLDGREETEA